MRIRKFLVVFIFMAILFLFAACSKDPATREAERFYKEYAQVLMEDSVCAITNYVHYEDEFLYHAALADAEVPTYVFELRSIEKLTDKLWVVSTYTENGYLAEGHMITNYVGVINGEYRIMVNDLQIPAELKENVDLSAYIPSDRIPYEDIFFPDEYTSGTTG